jgi:hypothetical protein
MRFAVHRVAPPRRAVLPIVSSGRESVPVRRPPRTVAGLSVGDVLFGLDSDSISANPISAKASNHGAIPVFPGVTNGLPHWESVRRMNV